MIGEGNYSFVESIYICDSPFVCYSKYVCGFISLFFVFLISSAVINLNRTRSMQVDIRDKLLLSVALG